jgi:hypothetical protein
MSAKPATVARYIAQVDPAIRPLFRATRAFVRKHAPAATERLCMGIPAYFVGGEQRFYLADHSRHVNLGFTTGTHEADPDRLLEGTGKNLRHVKVRAKEDLSPALARLVARASAPEPRRPRRGRAA